MSIQTELLAEIEAFLSRRDMKETTFGRLAVNDGKFVGRLRAGKNVGITTVEKVRRYIADESAKARAA